MTTLVVHRARPLGPRDQPLSITAITEISADPDRAALDSALEGNALAIALRRELPAATVDELLTTLNELRRHPADPEGAP